MFNESLFYIEFCYKMRNKKIIFKKFCENVLRTSWGKLLYFTRPTLKMIQRLS
jgi:hypothetical protein